MLTIEDAPVQDSIVPYGAGTCPLEIHIHVHVHPHNTESETEL